MSATVRRRAAVIIVSDRASRGVYEDKTGAALQDLLQRLGYDVTGVTLIPDELDRIAEILLGLSSSGVDYIVTSGGTGVALRDVTPEATRRVLKKEIPGIPEMLRMKSLEKTPFAVTSRAVCGIIGKSIVHTLNARYHISLYYFRHSLQYSNSIKRPEP